MLSSFFGLQDLGFSWAIFWCSNSVISTPGEHNTGTISSSTSEHPAELLHCPQTAEIFEFVPLYFNILMPSVALLINYEWERWAEGPKNHFNFRLHDQIDTIKQTDKNNDHIQRNKTNKPVQFEPSRPNRKLSFLSTACCAWNLFLWQLAECCCYSCPAAIWVEVPVCRAAVWSWRKQDCKKSR